jgi:uncharacterized integral membrane protein
MTKGDVIYKNENSIIIVNIIAIIIIIIIIVVNSTCKPDVTSNLKVSSLAIL